VLHLQKCVMYVADQVTLKNPVGDLACPSLNVSPVWPLSEHGVLVLEDWMRLQHCLYVVD
jgi:hypothetical protein